MMSYGDPFFRLFGKKSRHAINIAQSLQQFLTVAVLILGKTVNLTQLSKGKVCFSGMMCIVLLIGMLSGIIRSLTKIGWLSNAAVFINIANFLIIMIAAATYEPLYSAVTRSTLIKTIEPIVTFAGQPPDQYQQQVPGFASQFNAVNTMVYAYAGALLFVAFLAEMRHPLDFWKGLFLAQAFICIVYLLFGIFVYSFWGQYSANNIVNVISPYGLQSAGNVLTMLTGFIAVCKCIFTFLYDQDTIANIAHSHVLQHRNEDYLPRGPPASLQLPSHLHQEGQDLLVLSGSCLLVTRVRRRRRRAQHWRYRQLGRCRLHDELHLHFPRPAHAGPQGSAGRYSARRRLQPLHPRHHAPRHRHEALDPWFPQELEVEWPAHYLRPSRSGLLRHGCLGCD